MSTASSAWSNAWASLEVSEPPGLLDSLIARYKEQHRAYHNLRHIEECFDALAPASHLACRLAEVQLALWFHDAIYDPRAVNNEVESAGLAQRSVLLAGLDEEEADRIASIVLATRHEDPAVTLDARLAADVDLAILASPSRRFREYQSSIRAEYSFVPVEEFNRRRREILEGFLSRPAIYQTDWFRERFEMSARANIGNELGGST